MERLSRSTQNISRERGREIYRYIDGNYNLTALKQIKAPKRKRELSLCVRGRSRAKNKPNFRIDGNSAAAAMRSPNNDIVLCLRLSAADRF